MPRAFLVGDVTSQRIGQKINNPSAPFLVLRGYATFENHIHHIKRYLEQFLPLSTLAQVVQTEDFQLPDALNSYPVLLPEVFEGRLWLAIQAIPPNENIRITFGYGFSNNRQPAFTEPCKVDGEMFIASRIG
jgi:hypothetical protein